MEVWTQLEAYLQELQEQERSEGTLQKYRRDISRFLMSLNGEEITRSSVLQFKAELQDTLAVATVNSMLVAVNGFLTYLGRSDCRVKLLKQQRRLFRDSTRELSREEYERLVSTALKQGKERLALLIETICATGIRVSEVRYLTVEAVSCGQAEIRLKGKVRTILIPGKLAHKLQKYIRKEKIASGEIFITGSGKSLSRKQIWAEMKHLCAAAGVEPSKVFPHNLRHLFARTFYKASHDVAKLADVLAHSSIATTRIYLISTGMEHRQTMERLRLIL